MEWFREHMWETWLGLSLLLGVAEMFSLDLVLLMLAVGGLVGMFTALFGLPFALQVVAALMASGAMLALVRPNIVKKLHGGPELRLGAGKLVGMQGVATSDISALSPGRIKVDGESWSARPLDETITITAGETVDVLQIEGATAIVHPLPRLDS